MPIKSRRLSTEMSQFRISTANAINIAVFTKLLYIFAVDLLIFYTMHIIIRAIDFNCRPATVKTGAWLKCNFREENKDENHIYGRGQHRFFKKCNR